MDRMERGGIGLKEVWLGGGWGDGGRIEWSWGWGVSFFGIQVLIVIFDTVHFLFIPNTVQLFFLIFIQNNISTGALF